MTDEEFEALVSMIEAIVDDKLLNDDASALRRMLVINDVRGMFVDAALKGDARE